MRGPAAGTTDRGLLPLHFAPGMEAVECVPGFAFFCRFGEVVAGHCPGGVVDFDPSGLVRDPFGGVPRWPVLHTVECVHGGIGAGVAVTHDVDGFNPSHPGGWFHCDGVPVDFHLLLNIHVGGLSRGPSGALGFVLAEMVGSCHRYACRLERHDREPIKVVRCL